MCVRMYIQQLMFLHKETPPLFLIFRKKKKKSYIIPYNFYSIDILKPLFKKPLTQNSEYK